MQVSAIYFVVTHPSGERHVEIVYRDEVRTARVLYNPCKLEVIRSTGTNFTVALLTPDEARDEARAKERGDAAVLLQRRTQIAHEMLADVTCFEADVDVVWVWNAGPEDFVRHENTRITRELLGMAAESVESS